MRSLAGVPFPTKLLSLQLADLAFLFSFVLFLGRRRRSRPLALSFLLRSLLGLRCGLGRGLLGRLQRPAGNSEFSIY